MRLPGLAMSASFSRNQSALPVAVPYCVRYAASCSTTVPSCS